jgi:hypothetical protein
MSRQCLQVNLLMIISLCFLHDKIRRSIFEKLVSLDYFATPENEHGFYERLNDHKKNDFATLQESTRASKSDQQVSRFVSKL